MAAGRGVVSAVEPGSLACAAGIRPGDVVVAVNGVEPRDVIDVAYLASEEHVEFLVARAGRCLTLAARRVYGVPLGIKFKRALFDRIRSCSNRCVFCFVDQLPPDARASLRVKDDDYRLSYLTGSFVTLTNLTERDLERVINQRLSPLYVSVHSSDPVVRGRMLGLARPSDVMQPLKLLVAAGIELHTQIVLCPGYNDGDELARTVRDLASCWPGVRSVGIVPVGLSGHREGLPRVEPVGPELARRTVVACRAWASEFLASFGTRFVWCADELYLTAGLPVPAAPYYESFPQIENGVGLSRTFLDSFQGFPDASLAQALTSYEGAEAGKRATIVIATGELAHPLVRQVLEPLSGLGGLDLLAVPVRNTYLGGGVTVAGLLAGADVVSQIGQACSDLREATGRVPDLVVLPAAMFRRAVGGGSGTRLTVDGRTFSDVAQALRRRAASVRLACDGPSLSRVLREALPRVRTVHGHG